MKPYSVSVKAVVTVVAADKKQAARIAINAVANAPGLLFAEFITDGYESVASLEEDRIRSSPVTPRLKNTDPEEVF